MDEMKERLKEAADACAKAYDTWRAKTSDHSTREVLMDAVHELRKVAARLEIELAVADRQQNPNDPIPIPSHRAARRGGPGAQAPADDIGNTSGSDDFAGNRDRSPRRPQTSSTPRPVRTASDDGDQGGIPAPGSGKPLSLKRSSPASDSE